MKDEGAGSSSGTFVTDPVGAGSPVAECRAIADRHLERILLRVFQTIDDNLFDLSNKCTSDEERNQILEGIRLVRLEKEHLTTKFHEVFNRRCQECLRPPTELPVNGENEEAPAEDLALINESQLEESLAIDNMIAKIRDHFHDILFGLEQRFAHLLPEAAVDGKSIPYGPEVLCHAFQEVYQSLNLDIRLKLYIYKLLDRVLMDEVGELYHDLDQCLIRRGILPKLKIRVRKSEGSGVARRGNSSPPADMPQESALGETVAVESADQRAVSIQVQMFQALQYLLNSQFKDQGGEGPCQEGAVGPANAPPVTPLLVDILSELQQDISRLNLAIEQGATLKEQVKRRFNTQRGEEGDGRINQLDDETIDVIGMIFDYILDDRSLPDFIKAMIARLQIPVLKVAIIDRQFFRRKDHPARQLLNELAYAGLGWLRESEAAKDRLYEKMEYIVLRILHEFDNDIAIFDELLAEFRAFIDEEKQKFAKAQERIRRESEQRERLRREAVTLVASRLQGRQIPADVRDFLLGAWRQVLVDAALQHGVESPERQKALQVMDDLIWSLSPEAAGEGRRKLLLILPLMLDALREGLQGIGFGEQELEHVMDMLGQYHIRILKPEHHDLTNPPGEGCQEDDIDRLIKKMNADIEALPELDGEDVDIMGDILATPPSEKADGFARILAEMGLEAEVDHGPKIEDQFTELVRSLELGTWVELEKDGSKTRVKLAWKGDEFTSYTFMNRQYQVVAELPLYTLAEEFRRGRARLIEDVALFDRALDGVISGIMKFTR